MCLEDFLSVFQFSSKKAAQEGNHEDISAGQKGEVSSDLLAMVAPAGSFFRPLAPQADRHDSVEIINREFRSFTTSTKQREASVHSEEAVEFSFQLDQLRSIDSVLAEIFFAIVSRLVNTGESTLDQQLFRCPTTQRSVNQELDPTNAYSLSFRHRKPVSCAC